MIGLVERFALLRPYPREALMSFVKRVVRQLLGRIFKRPQISLLALLVMVAVSAVLIQFVILPAYRRSARESILEQITKLNGTWVDLQKEPLQRRLLLQGKKVDDEFINRLAGVVTWIPELIQLDLMGTPVSDESWEAVLRRKSQIKHYVLFNNAITKQAITQARFDYPDVLIEERRPDSMAAKLAKAPIPSAAIISLAHDTTSNQLLFGSGDGRLHQLKMDGRSKRTSVKKHGDWLFDIAISPSRKWIATAGGDNQLSIHRAKDLQTVATGEGHQEDVHGVVWLNDQRLVTSGDDMTLRLWDLQTDENVTLKPIASLTAHDKQVPRVIKINADTILTLSRDQTIRRWHVGDSGVELQQSYEGHQDDCMDASVSPDGSEIASVSYDGQLILWNSDSGQPAKVHRCSKERLFSLHVDWRARTAVVGSQSCVRLMKLDSGELVNKNADQTFVSKIIPCNGRLLTSDGFGRIYQRNPVTLETLSKFQIYEGNLDVFSSDAFKLAAILSVPHY